MIKEAVPGPAERYKKRPAAVRRIDLSFRIHAHDIDRTKESNPHYRILGTRGFVHGTLYNALCIAANGTAFFGRRAAKSAPGPGPLFTVVLNFSLCRVVRRLGLFVGLAQVLGLRHDVLPALPGGEGGKGIPGEGGWSRGDPDEII